LALLLLLILGDLILVAHLVGLHLISFAQIGIIGFLAYIDYCLMDGYFCLFLILS